VITPPALAGMGLAVLFRGARLLDPLQNESRPGERVDVLGERALGFLLAVVGHGRDPDAGDPDEDDKGDHS